MAPPDAAPVCPPGPAPGPDAEIVVGNGNGDVGAVVYCANASRNAIDGAATVPKVGFALSGGSALGATVGGSSDAGRFARAERAYGIAPVLVVASEPSVGSPTDFSRDFTVRVGEDSAGGDVRDGKGGRKSGIWSGGEEVHDDVRVRLELGEPGDRDLALLDTGESGSATGGISLSGGLGSDV